MASLRKVTSTKRRRRDLGISKARGKKATKKNREQHVLLQKVIAFVKGEE